MVATEPFNCLYIATCRLKTTRTAFYWFMIILCRNCVSSSAWILNLLAKIKSTSVIVRYTDCYRPPHMQCNQWVLHINSLAVSGYKNVTIICIAEQLKVGKHGHMMNDRIKQFSIQSYPTLHISSHNSIMICRGDCILNYHPYLVSGLLCAILIYPYILSHF